MDKSLFRLVIIALGATVLLAVTGLIVLAVVGRPVPSELVSLAFASLTGITGLLARHPDGDTAVPVTVVNPPSDPVNTADTADTAEVDPETDGLDSLQPEPLAGAPRRRARKAV